LAIFAAIGVLGGTSYAFIDASGAAPSSAAGARDGVQQFIGTWRMTEFKAVTGTGQVVYPFGTDARGLLTYTDEGRMWGVIWKSNRQPFAVNDQQRGTPEEYTAAVQSYIQYFGTFDVDQDAGVINHRLEQSIFPNWNGTTQTRFFTFSDHFNRLVLSTPPIPFGGTTIVGTVSWVRLEPHPAES
jgi:hypothetical protein